MDNLEVDKKTCCSLPVNKKNVNPAGKHKCTESMDQMEEDLNMNLVPKGFALSVREEHPLKTLVPRMEKLQLSSENLSETAEVGICTSEKLAGHIQKAIPTMNIIVVDPAAGSEFLALGTVLFIRQSNSDDNFSRNRYVEFGCVDDVFGLMNSPSYSIELSQQAPADIWSFLRTGVEVFYMEDHPSTMHIRVERVDDRFKVVTRKNKAKC